MLEKLFILFKKNFPYIIREEKTVKDILSNVDNIFILEKKKDTLIGASVINKNTILMLCVNQEYRNKGIGSRLLDKSEKIIKENGFKSIIVGEGFDYLMPGVPTTKKYYNSENEHLYQNLNEEASNFFTKRGYFHSWDCNCFDMRFELKDFKENLSNIGDTIDGITYKWATIKDLKEINKCVTDAEPKFVEFYQNNDFYKDTNNQRVLIAKFNNEVVGTLIISVETEGKNIGSIGCTTVKKAYRGKHIAVNMIILGTKYLKGLGLKEAFLGYTYSGLDHLYGYAGYKICIYYMMAKKELK